MTVSITRKGHFPLSQLRVEVNGDDCFYLKVGESRSLELPEGNSIIIVRASGLKVGKSSIFVDDRNTSLILTNYYSDFVYLVCSAIILILLVLTFLSLLKPIVISLALLVYVLPLFCSILTKKYIRVKTKYK